MKRLLACLFYLSAFFGSVGLHAQQPTATPQKEQTGAPAPAAAKITPAKEADIRRFMQLTGGDEIREQLTKQIQSSMRPTLENSLPPGEYRPELINLFLQKFGPRVADDVIFPMIVSVYDTHFSDEELKQLIAFYESPLGKKAASVLPAIDAQIPVVQQSTETLAQTCMAEVLSEHPSLQEAMEKAEKAEPSH